MSTHQPRSNAPQFSSLDAATDSMDVTNEPLVATTQLFFRDGPAPSPAAASPRPSTVSGHPVAPLPVDAVALMEELLLRLRGNRRTR